MEYNAIAVAKLILQRIVKQEDLPSMVRNDLQTALQKLDDQMAYCQAVEYELTQTIRYYKQDRYSASPIAKCTYEKTYDHAYIDDVLKHRVIDLRNGGKQCVFCNHVTLKPGSACPDCGFDYAVTERVYDNKVKGFIAEY